MAQPDDAPAAAEAAGKGIDHVPAGQAPADLPPAALRALAEAEERRRKAKARPLPPEVGGRTDPEPVRFGDWERKGIAIDF